MPSRSPVTLSPEALQQTARDHLWGHFSRLSPGADGISVIERGEGCYVWDSNGKRYLDGLAGLFTVQAGHGRAELAAAAGTQAAELGYFPLWTYAHPTAIELAGRLAALAPGNLNRVFFTSGGGEAVESAWKLARQYFAAIGQPQRRKVISRDLAYHGTTMGALSITGLAAIRAPFEPLVPGTSHVPNTNRYRCRYCAAAPQCTLACADEIEVAILREEPETVAAVYLEPVQNSGGCFTPSDGYFARVREICDRYGVLLVSDEVICAFGRLGAMFGSERLGYQPDMITMAKGLTSGYSPLGGVLVGDHIAEPFLEPGASFLHGITFGGHPVSCAVALANLDLFENERLVDRVLTYEHEFRAALDSLSDLPIVGEIRGMGYFYGIELVKDPVTRETFDDDESERLLRGVLTPMLLGNGLICRADDRGDPVIQLSPPLVAGPEQFEEIAVAVRQGLVHAMKEMS
jgi:adenosylmethionine-8-amino-7-oxononanoate aminotransferase